MCRSRASGGRLTQASRLGNASKIGPFFLKYAVPISQKTCRATPNDAEALALYQGVSETCKKYNVKTPVYCAELEPIAQEIAKAAVIHRYYTTQPSAAVINKAKMDVSALMDGAEYLVYELNPYDTAAKAPLSVNSMKNTIIQKGANRVGIAIVTLTNADTKEEVKYECTVYVRFPDAAAQE